MCEGEDNLAVDVFPTEDGNVHREGEDNLEVDVFQTEDGNGHHLLSIMGQYNIYR